MAGKGKLAHVSRCNTGFPFLSWGFFPPQIHASLWWKNEHLARFVFSWRWEDADFWSCCFIFCGTLSETYRTFNCSLSFPSTNWRYETPIMRAVWLYVCHWKSPPAELALWGTNTFILGNWTCWCILSPWEKFLPDRSCKQNMLSDVIYGTEESLVESLL